MGARKEDIKGVCFGCKARIIAYASIFCFFIMCILFVLACVICVQYKEWHDDVLSGEINIALGSDVDRYAPRFSCSDYSSFDSLVLDMADDDACFRVLEDYRYLINRGGLSSCILGCSNYEFERLDYWSRFGGISPDKIEYLYSWNSCVDKCMVLVEEGFNASYVADFVSLRNSVMSEVMDSRSNIMSDVLVYGQYSNSVIKDSLNMFHACSVERCV